MSRLSIRGAPLLLALLALAGCLVLFGRSFFGGRFVVDVSHGMDVYHLSLLYERFGVHVSSGHFPVYFPELGGGYPVAAAWMYGLFYPPTMLLALLPPDLGWTMSAALHLLLAALGMVVFLERPLGSGVAAVTAGLVYAFSEYMVGRVVCGHLNLVWSAAWAPWALWVTGRVARCERGGIPLLGLILGVSLLAGHVQVWFYLAPLVAVYAILETARAPSRRRALLGLLAGALLAAGVAAVQWVSTAELAVQTGKPAGDQELLLEFAAPPHVLASKVLPGSLGDLPVEAEGGAYWGGGRFPHEYVSIGGPAVLLLAVLGLFGRGRGRWLWLAAALAGFLLAPGRHTPVSAWLNELPVISWGRAAARSLHITVLGTSVLTGYGVSAWLDRERPLGRCRAAWGSLCSALAAAAAVGGLLLWMRGSMDSESFARRFADTVAPAALRGLGGLAVVAAGLLLVRRRPRAAPALPALVLVSVLWCGVPPVQTAPSDFYFHDWSTTLPPEVREHRIHVVEERFPNLERQGLRCLRPMSHADAPGYLRMIRSGNAAYVFWLDYHAVLAKVGRDALLRGPPFPRAEITAVFPVCGRAMFFPLARAAATDEEAMEVLATGRLTLLLAGPEAPGWPPPDAPEEPSITERIEVLHQADPNRVAIRVATPRAGWLYVSEKHYANWRAEVDGEEVPLRRGNVFGIAVPVPAGAHEVDLRFTSAGIDIGLPVSLASLAICCAGLLLAWRRRLR